MNLSLILSAITAHALAVISPGPDFVMAVKNTLTYSRKTGIYTAIGFGLGIGIHILYSFFGISLIMSQNKWVFNIVKFLGAGYLIYMGIMILKSRHQSITTKATHSNHDISTLNAIKIGFLTNVLNPKASLFFLSLFTFILKHNPNPLTIGIICFFLIVNTALWFTLVAIFFNHTLIRQQYNKQQHIIQIVLGILLIGIGISIVAL